ncbi:MAG TPA: response regulator, partial [Armatimonadota bacterium]|nr:response regulator [Armatimonadota bacterium]
MAARILVVEGDKNVLDLITSGLADDGYELVSVPSAEDALQVAKNDRVDLILLEVELPGMSGFDMVKQLRMDPAMQATPIIFLTGRTGLQD